MPWLRRGLFGISPEEVSFQRRGFRAVSEGTRLRLEEIARTFVGGYHTALEEAEPLRLAARLSAVEPELRGFAHEGAAMGLALLDALTPWRRNRFQQFLAGAGNAHAYMLHVGAGWVLGRLRLRCDRFLDRMDPLLRWLAVDGFAFHQCFFSPQTYVEEGKIDDRLTGYARQAFDQGVGRALWFVEGADPDRVAGRVESLPAERQGRLWSGVGLACAYAGGVTDEAVVRLRERSADQAAALAQGAAFAAKARQRAGNPTDHTERACRLLCGLSADAAAAVTDACLADLPADHETPAFEVWRIRIQNRFREGRRG